VQELSIRRKLRNWNRTLIFEKIENGNIRDQKDFNRWAANYSKGQGSNNSASFVAEDRRANANNAGLDSETQQGKPRRGQSNQNSQDDFGTGFIRVYNNDVRRTIYSIFIE
jgi:hypothetical protein